MNRRSFLESAARGMAAGGIGAWSFGSVLSGIDSSPAAGSTIEAQALPSIQTVTGAVAPDDFGFVLPHEHVMSRFGPPANPRPSYDRQHIERVVLPYLRYIRELGVDTICECTAAYFGRRPGLLRELSERSGLQILTNTGYYGAAGDRYVPEHAYSDTVRGLAERWIEEAEEGIQPSGIRPGFMKIGIDDGPLSEIDRKLVEAAAEAHRETGLTMAVHHSSASEQAVPAEMDILEAAGVHPGAWIWVHAQNVSSPEALEPALEVGGWVEFDGLAADTLDRHLTLVNAVRDAGYLDRVLLSHDGNTYAGPNRPIRHYDALMTAFLGRLRAAGYSGEEIQQLTVTNPREAFVPRVRALQR